MTYYHRYVVEQFCSIYNIDQQTIDDLIQSKKLVLTNCSESFFNGYKAHPENITWVNWLDKNIPILFSETTNDPVIESKGNSVIINYDIIGAAFFFLSGWQEIHVTRRDKYGRFPFVESIQFLTKTAQIPVVNYYFDIFKEAIEQVSGKKLARKLWPDNQFIGLVSHDIDFINSGWKQDSFHSFKRGNLISLFKIIFNKFLGKDSWNNISDILDLEKKLNISSTFFFLPRKSAKDADYKLKEVQNSIEIILSSKSEIGIHGSINSGFIKGWLQEDLQKIGKAVKGNRFHYLAFESSKWIPIIEETELCYDTSAGFAENIGFRNGICFPFKPYCFKNKRSADFYEFPLTIMDTTLRNSFYMGSKNNKIDLIKSIIDEVAKFNGICTFLWHNNYFSPYKFKGWTELFIESVAYSKKKGGLFTTYSNILEEYYNE